MSGRNFFAGLTLALLLLADPARALDEGDDAAALLRRGVALRREGRDQDALAVFGQAVAISPTPSARAQVALAEQALGHWLDAERDLDSVLGADDPWIEKNRGALEAARSIVRGNLAWLTVDVDVPSADVQLDGQSVPRGSEARVVAGTGVLEVRASGYVPEVRRVALSPGEHVHQAISLVLLVASSAPPVPAAVPIVAPRPAPEVAAPSSSPLPIGPIALGIAGLAGVATGGYYGIRTFEDKAALDTHCAGGCKPAASSDYSDGQFSGTVSEAALGAGVALVAGGVVWWLLERGHRQRPDARLQVTPVVGVAMRGLAIQWVR